MAKPASYIALCATLLASCPAVAQVIAPPLAFDCDVPAGRASVWAGKLTTDGLIIEGKIQFIELRKHASWRPLASVLLIDKADKSLTGLQLSLETASAKNMQLVLIAPSEPEKRIVFATGPWKDNQVQFQLVLSKSGNAKATVGSTSATTSIGDSKPTRIVLSCSSAEVRFTEISLTALDS